AAGSEIAASLWLAFSMPPLRTLSIALRTSAMSASDASGAGLAASTDSVLVSTSSEAGGTGVSEASESPRRLCSNAAALWEIFSLIFSLILAAAFLTVFNFSAAVGLGFSWLDDDSATAQWINANRAAQLSTQRSVDRCCVNLCPQARKTGS